MTSYNYDQEPSAPMMYPIMHENIRPVPPVRAEFMRDPQQQSLIAPEPPARMDIPQARPPRTDVTLRRNDNEENIGDTNLDSTCNYQKYAIRKTIGHVLLVVAILLSNAMQLRILILQKHHDGTWIATLTLVCLSIITIIGLGVVLYFLFKDDIRNPNKQTKLERYNTLALVIIAFLTTLNVTINMLMLTINPKSFLDDRSLDLLQQKS